MIGKTSRHAVTKPFGKSTDIKHRTVGHIFSAEIANTFHNHRGTGIAHRKPVTGLTLDKRTSTGGTKQGKIANQHIFTSTIAAAFGGFDNNFATASTLANTIITGAGVL